MNIRALLTAFLLAPCVAASAFAQVPRMIGPTGATYAVPVTSLKGARFISTLRQQYDFSCGSAAVATLLTHQYGRKVDEIDVFKYMFDRGDQAKIQREGFSMLDMKLYLDSTGFRAEGIEASLDQLAKAGVPAIALINENGYHHFVVVKGLRGNRVVLGDPAMGTRVLGRDEFEKFWTNGIFLVVNNRMDLAQFNREEDWRVKPKAPINSGIGSSSIDMLLLRRGPMDF